MSFNIRIKSNPQLVLKNDGDDSLLETLRKAGIEVPTSCENGVCATCKGKIYQGEVSYPHTQPSGLMPDEEANHEALFCCAHPRSDCLIDHPELLLPGEYPARFFKLVLIQTRPINPHVTAYKFKTESPVPFKFLAGQYIELILKNHRYPLSIVTSPEDYLKTLELEIHIVQSDLTQENKLKTALENPEKIMLYGPKGRAYLRKNLPGDLVFLAGGSGITPMLSIIPEALKNFKNSNSTQQVYLYWGARSPELLYAVDLIKTWQKEFQNFHFVPVLNTPVHTVLLGHFEKFSQPSIFMAGPPAMVQAAQTGLLAKNLPNENIFGDGLF